jgi:biotin carboxyl carrier protein
MKLKVELKENVYDVSLTFRDGRVIAQINDRPYELDIRELGNAQYLLTKGTEVYDYRVEPRRDTFNSFDVSLRGVRYDLTVIDPKRLRIGQTAGAHLHGSAEIVSPMPGKVVRVLVNAGDQVQAGAGVIVVEAMKMQNEMKAPKAGIVTSVNAAEGVTVNAGDVLAVIE